MAFSCVGQLRKRREGRVLRLGKHIGPLRWFILEQTSGSRVLTPGLSRVTFWDILRRMDLERPVFSNMQVGLEGPGKRRAEAIYVEGVAVPD